ncbi:EAL domain-containing protein [Klebsiella michiganensis]|uniref:EAL domain-containing protein n=1 Tax=Klebsiella michiganensis TaxID=1134687 RepID=UPI000B48F044|nr:EAL domain-containing protein [Klebsiella michiganensis]MBZ7429852.1 sensor domain-containing phosphodiesterase [Klebsiella michiganensis]MDM4467897.1 EAL domain-containing protein [Klebsiella michiganensis]UHC86192.1 sensor domain-containing phosphodiesterase [Klebsiella michiganensis]HBM2932293.1 sensor domain-containing phosphodiesterase [Klebsiella michiganensis]HCT2065575.1 sensor domain-containing phosphodiesterase [Klebsiella michiganensis]
MIDHLNIKIKKTLLALLVCFIAIPLSRFISPQTIIDGNQIYLAWLPLSLMYSVLFIFGRYAVAPLIIAFAITNDWIIDLTLTQALILLFCQLFSVFLSCAIVRFQLGRRWRAGLTAKHMGVRIFWGGFFAPLLLKVTMYLAGRFFAFPLAISSYFGSMSVIYTIIDIQSLISAALIFTTFFYYPLRMIISPRYARAFWRNLCHSWRAGEQRVFTLYWFVALAAILLVLCTPYDSVFIAGYLVPLIFILYFIGISRLGHTLIRISWSVSAFLLVAYNQNFLHGVQTEYSLSFVLSVLICFTICLFYMADIYARSERMKFRWRDQAEEDPLTGLPNLRALESHLQRNPAVAISSLRIQNLDFLSRHYGMMMRVESKRQIARKLQPLLAAGERIFQLPGSELLLVLKGPEPEARLSHIVSTLNHKKFSWNNQALDLEFGASWGGYRGTESELHPMLGQLSWLSEQAGAARRVLPLDAAQEQISDQTSEQVRLLAKIKQALNERGLVLYAQPIRDASGEGYYEILSRMRCGNTIITPDRFIPLIAQFNLSQRFDMQVLETLFSSLNHHQGQHFSVNLLPYTLMQKDSATQIIALFKRYNLSAEAITIEVTEEQAFSDVETSMHNIQLLRDFGCGIAIDDFGTGYANYERLKSLRADILKIDGCFVRDIETDPLDAIMVKSIIEMAKVKKMKVVAEYVETPEQREKLLELGVDYLQGYLVGKPLPLSELRA